MNWSRSVTYIWLLFLISVPPWAWIAMVTGTLFVIGCVIAFLRNRRIYQRKNSPFGKEREYEQIDHQKVSLPVSCHFVFIVCLFVCLMVFNVTFNNISVISWQSVLLVEETIVPG